MESLMGFGCEDCNFCALSVTAGAQITPDHLLPCLLRHLLQVLLLLLSTCAAGACLVSKC